MAIISTFGIDGQFSTKLSNVLPGLCAYIRDQVQISACRLKT